MTPDQDYRNERRHVDIAVGDADHVVREQGDGSERELPVAQDPQVLQTGAQEVLREHEEHTHTSRCPGGSSRRHERCSGSSDVQF
jgi:hypothetical protein